MKNDFLYVTIAKRENISLEGVRCPKWRIKEIEEDPFQRVDRIYIWALLTKAFKDALGVDLKNFYPHKTKTGKLVLRDYYVSLSHSRGYYMVAISSENVGVDIQNTESRALKLLLDDKLWAEEEQKIIENKSSDMFVRCRLWTRKESLYKYLDPGVPFENNEKDFNILNYPDFFITYGIDENRAIFSVCSPFACRGLLELKLIL